MQNFYNACYNIIDNKNSKALNYAVGYAEYGTGIIDKHEAKVQALYILNNITHWRGDIAKKTRKMLKDYVKEND